MPTATYNFATPTVGGSNSTWGASLNANWELMDDLLDGTAPISGAPVFTGAPSFSGSPDFSAAANKPAIRAALGLGTAATTDLIDEDNMATNSATRPPSQQSVKAYVDANSASPIPSGVILLWSGSIATIPSGWALCDGTNGTPNLTGRFVVHADADAAGTYAPGATGGANSVILTEAQMPSHTHAFSGTTDNASLTFASTNTATTRFPEELSHAATVTSNAHNHSFSGTTNAAGSGSAHENRPPYYALAYIMKL